MKPSQLVAYSRSKWKDQDSEVTLTQAFKTMKSNEHGNDHETFLYSLYLYLTYFAFAYFFHPCLNMFVCFTFLPYS